jgi:hypothetical protein
MAGPDSVADETLVHDNMHVSRLVSRHLHILLFPCLIHCELVLTYYFPSSILIQRPPQHTRAASCPQFSSPPRQHHLCPLPPNVEGAMGAV